MAPGYRLPHREVLPCEGLADVCLKDFIFKTDALHCNDNNKQTNKQTKKKIKYEIKQSKLKIAENKNHKAIRTQAEKHRNPNPGHKCTKQRCTFLFVVLSY